MALYFSSNQFSELSEYNMQQRREILSLAIARLTTPEKLIINLIKLVMLMPPFFLLANLQSTWFLVSIFGVLLGYLLIMRPISLTFAKKYLPKAIVQYEVVSKE